MAKRAFIDTKNGCGAILPVDFSARNAQNHSNIAGDYFIERFEFA